MSILAGYRQTFGRRPIILVEITRGSDAYRYHMGRKDVVFNGEVFSASPLMFEGVTYSAESKKDDLTINNFPLSSQDTLDIMQDGGERTKLVLYKMFDGIEGHVVFYQGYMTSTKTGRKTASFVFASWSVDASVRGDGYVAQRQCPWRLYSSLCGVDKGDFDVPGTVTSMSRNNIVSVAAADLAEDGYFSGGMLEFGTQSRTIIRHVGPLLTLSGSFPALRNEMENSGSASVLIYPGCDKSNVTCRDRFNNIDRHLGFAMMNDNPFVRRVF